MSSKGKSSVVTGGGAVSVPERRFPEFHEAGAWESVSLGSVASISTKKVGDETCIPMSITSGVGLVSQMEKFGRIIAGESYKNYLLLQKNDFAYNKSATKEFPEGFIALYAGEELAAVPNSIFTCFRVKEDAISPSYLNYLFLGNLHGRWLRKFIEVGARAHGSLSINDRDLLALPIPIPAGPNSLREQQKIADCLDSADALIAAQVRKVETLRAHKKGLMQQLFPQEGETQPRLRFPEFEGAEQWEEVAVSSVAKITTGSRDTQNKVEVGEFPFFVRSQTVERIDSFALDCEAVLTSGDGVGVGKNFHYIDGKFDFHQRVYCIYEFKKRLRGKFFFYFFSEFFGSRVMKMSAKNSVDSVRMAMIAEMPILLPSPQEQERIANCLTSLDDLIAAETLKLDTLKTHKKGLMQQLFPQIGQGDA